MDRRAFVQATTAALAALPAAFGPSMLATAAGAEGTALAAAPTVTDELRGGVPHDFDTVIALARGRAAETFASSDVGPPPPFADLDARDHAAIQPDPEARIALGGTPPMAAEPLPPGFVFSDPVALHRVENGLAFPVPLTLAAFRFDPERFPADRLGAAEGADLSGAGFSGFRLLGALERPDALETVAIFQGASGFRARHRGSAWGASARGLAIGTGSAAGEEVPVFTRFWLHAGDENGRGAEIHALLESASLTGAYSLEIRPGAETAIVVRARLFPRSEITHVGIAPLASMYLFGPHARRRIDDLRDAVHDSDGLQMISGRGERIWRPLTNPANLQLSGFLDENPRAFGLSQRARDWRHFGDPSGRFEARPSVWVEPHGEWGRGQIVLVEIPLPNEVNDNIVAFWRPARPLQAGEGYAFDYTLNVAPQPADAAPLARVVGTRSGAAGDGRRRFAVDFDRSAAPEGALDVRLSASRGRIDGVSLEEMPTPGHVRAGFTFVPEGADLAEFRLYLAGSDGAPASETWLHRWTVQ